MVPLGIGAVTLATFPAEMLDMLYTSPAGDAVTAFMILMFALVPVGVVYIYSTMLTASWKLKMLGVITVSGMIINLSLNRILIPELGLAGAASAALITQTLVAVACMLTVRRTMSGIAGNGRILLFLLMLGLTFLTGWFLRTTGTPWIAAAALELATGIILALLFRFIEPLSGIRLITGMFGTE